VRQPTPGRQPRSTWQNTRQCIRVVRPVDNDRERRLLAEAIREHASNLNVNASGAALDIVDGWFDAGFAKAAIKRYLTLGNPARLIIGPWNNGGWMDASSFHRSATSAFKIDGELLRFFNHYLKGTSNGVENLFSISRWARKSGRAPIVGRRTVREASVSTLTLADAEVPS